MTDAIFNASHYTVLCGGVFMALNLAGLFSYKMGTVGAWLILFGICENVIAGWAS